MAWPKPGPGRPRVLAPEDRLGPHQRDAFLYLRSVPANVFPDTREIAAHIHKLSAEREACEWAAERTGLGIEQVRRVLTGALVKSWQMENGRRAVDALEAAGLIVATAGGWELQERIDERAHARTEQERAEQERLDLLVARSWLENNWEIMTRGGEPEGNAFEPFRRERRADLQRAIREGRYIGALDALSIQRGLELLGGPDDAVLLCDLTDVDHLTEDERKLWHHQLSLEPESTQKAPEPPPQSEFESPRSASHPPPEQPQPHVASEKERVAYIAKLQERMRWYEEDLPELDKDITERETEAADADAAVAVAQQELDERRAQRKGSKRAEAKLKVLRENADLAARDVVDARQAAENHRTKMEEHRLKLNATEAGMAAAAEARAAGKPEDVAQALGKAAYEAALKQA